MDETRGEKKKIDSIQFFGYSLLFNRINLKYKDTFIFKK